MGCTILRPVARCLAPVPSRPPATRWNCRQGLDIEPTQVSDPTRCGVLLVDCRQLPTLCTDLPQNDPGSLRCTEGLAAFMGKYIAMGEGLIGLMAVQSLRDAGLQYAASLKERIRLCAPRPDPE